MRLAIIDDGRITQVTAADDGSAIRLPEAALREALGWERKPEGLCRGDVCVPVDPHPGLVNEDGVDLERFAELLERPIAIDRGGAVASLGASVASGRELRESLMAPDFRLPDLAGKLHSLSEQRGKKVLLVAYASW
jgi:hypothetical protein